MINSLSTESLRNLQSALKNKQLYIISTLNIVMNSEPIWKVWFAKHGAEVTFVCPSAG